MGLEQAQQVLLVKELLVGMVNIIQTLRLLVAEAGERQAREEHQF